MEIEDFRKKMQELSERAEMQGKRLLAEQVQDYFPDLEEEQRVLILRYLRTKGIQVADEEEPTGSEEQNAAGDQQKKKSPTENPCLTEKDRAWLIRYKEELAENSGTAAYSSRDGQEDIRLRRYLPVAADMAAEAYRDGMNLPDLVQEANLALLTILAGDSAQMDETELLRRLRLGVREAANGQDEQNFGDETLVARVRNLEAVLKDLTEDGGEPKFTVEELAIMLDMDLDEMRDIIRLTGEGD